MIRRLLDLLVPGRCLGCGRSGTEFCDGCFSAVAHLWLEDREAVFEDAGPVARLVRAGKHGRAWRAAQVMAELTVEFEELPDDFDWITWVPHDPQRGRQRGMHLPELYATQLARLLGVPTRSTMRREPGVAQRGSTRAERLSNMPGAFVSLNGQEDVPRMLLVDDVRTTGATLWAAMQVLAVAYPDTVIHMLAFASVPRRDGTDRSR